MREIKFRVFLIDRKCYVNQGMEIGNLSLSGKWNNYYILEQYTGLKDKNGKEIYEGDIGEFDNGDRFVIECEDWLELGILWIGEPECEDQAKDLYRIENAVIIGNIHENPELLK